MYHTMITTTAWQQTFMNKNEVGVGGGEGEGRRWMEGVVVRGVDGGGNRCSGKMGEMCSGDGGSHKEGG